MTILLELYLAFVSILVIVVVQLVITIIIMTRLRRLQKEVHQLLEKVEPRFDPTSETASGENAPKEFPTADENPVASPQKPTEIQNGDETQVSKEPQMSKKEKVLNAIKDRSKAIYEDDLPRVQNELLSYFTLYAATSDYFIDIDSKDYYRFIDLRTQATSRVVVIGDVHCDFISLSALLLKLSVSKYDYFDDAYFVFLGDYLDRGSSLFELLLLLMDLKRILGDRMIMLRGNHEQIKYCEDETVGGVRYVQQVASFVRPQNTCPVLNEYCGDNKEFLKSFGYFFQTLPTYVYLKTSDKNILLTHASIPKDIFIDAIRFEETDGAMVFSTDIPVVERLTKRNKILNDMIWGDPRPCEEKIQSGNRFEYGRKQFEQWVFRNHIDLMFRSHEEADYGYTPFFNDRLFTIFSSGGNENPQTYYSRVEPAFAVIQNGRFFIENSFIYKKTKGCINLFTKQVYTEKQIINYKLEDEFACDEMACQRVRDVFKMFQNK